MEGTSACTGQQFFESLVKNLAEILDVFGVWVTEYLEDQNRLRALAFYLDGEFVDEYEYQVQGTPCEPVLTNEGICHIPDRVIELYPDDPDLEPLGAVSYMGIALKDVNGHVLGHLAILDNKPMDEIPEYFAIFRIFASRATAELSRMNSERVVMENKEKLDRLMNGAREMIIEFNDELNITQINRSVKDTLDYFNENDEKRSISSLFDEESMDKILNTIRDFRENSSDPSSVWIPGPLCCLKADHEKIPVEASISTYSYQREIFFALFIRNIQDQLQSENKIKKLDMETTLLKEKINEHEFNDILGTSIAIQDTLNLVGQVAGTTSTVLIQGETGTGKELIAQAIHQASQRKNESFITLNCAALPAELIESELFGHVKGAYTGATQSRDGRFLLADQGTIFLDEIGELPLQLQPKLLRVLQEGTFESVGSSHTRKVDVRVIAATNRDLKTEVKLGKFREDLYYRLNVFPVPVPPLRKRGEDIILLAEAFMKKFSRKYGLAVAQLDHQNKMALRKYSWPGNVRELHNIVERAVIISRDGKINFLKLLPGTEMKEMGRENPSEAGIIYTEKEMIDMERKNILMALEKTNWKVSGKNGAANLLEIPSTTLNSRMIKLGISNR
ncbi:MAG: sigma 54-interacting transcriptional regulator [Cyclobacteriaceae bacterium]|nr:sigma 54-interacting transcriptional regulator [Cyclobacteriaceae bacterium]